LAEFPLPTEDIRKGISIMCKEVHQSIEHQATKFEQMLKRKVYNTPKSYLDLITLYMQCLKEKREALSSNLRRMKSGITKLESSNKLVSELKVRKNKL
jgi:dynein heavy chain, axonemal